MSTFPFYLIQRAWTKKNVPVTPATRIDDFIRWDYMGHAEFEWGALGKSLVRILHRFGEYNPLPTDLLSKDGKRVWVFTRDDSIPEKLTAFADRPEPNRWDLKDPSYLEDVRKNAASTETHGTPSFWFGIDNSTDRFSCYNNGDWMALFEDDLPSFLMVMYREKAIWDGYSEDERQSYLDDSQFYDE